MKVIIKNNWEEWEAIRNVLADNIPLQINQAKANRSYDQLLIYSLLKQSLQRIDVRIASGASRFSIGFTYAEALAFRLAMLKGMIIFNEATYEGYITQLMLNQIHQKTA